MAPQDRRPNRSEQDITGQPASGATDQAAPEEQSAKEGTPPQSAPQAAAPAPAPASPQSGTSPSAPTNTAGGEGQQTTAEDVLGQSAAAAPKSGIKRLTNKTGRTQILDFVERTQTVQPDATIECSEDELNLGHVQSQLNAARDPQTGRSGWKIDQ